MLVQERDSCGSELNLHMNKLGYLSPTWFKYYITCTLFHWPVKSNANSLYWSVQIKLQNSKSTGAILTAIKKGKDKPLISNLLSSTLSCGCGIWRVAWENEGWIDEKKRKVEERQMPLPDAASLGQLISAEEWPLLCERCPSVLLFLATKERLILPSHQHIKASVISHPVHSLLEFTCCESLWKQEPRTSTDLKKKTKKTQKTQNLNLLLLQYCPYFAHPGRT